MGSASKAGCSYKHPKPSKSGKAPHDLHITSQQRKNPGQAGSSESSCDLLWGGALDNLSHFGSEAVVGAAQAKMSGMGSLMHSKPRTNSQKGFVWCCNQTRWVTHESACLWCSASPSTIQSWFLEVSWTAKMTGQLYHASLDLFVCAGWELESRRQDWKFRLNPFPHPLKTPEPWWMWGMKPPSQVTSLVEAALKVRCPQHQPPGDQEKWAP